MSQTPAEGPPDEGPEGQVHADDPSNQTPPKEQGGGGNPPPEQTPDAPS